jgi:NAD/NADP transhydrogenase alpha subunit
VGLLDEAVDGAVAFQRHGLAFLVLKRYGGKRVCRAGGIAVALAAVNIFGGFLVTQRMLAMYKKKEKK